jgi:transposase
MESIYEASPHTSEQVGTGADMFGQWLSVQEAVAYCLSKGLHRTPKTVRKWAQRARDPESGTAEISVKAQDTENGFRWLIERSSLDVKIEQEKQFELRKDGEANGEHLSAQVATGAHTSAPVLVEEQTVHEMSTPPHTSEQVGTGANLDNGQMIDFLMEQIDTKDQQLAVKDRQIESMLERDHETNILIQGLQTSLTGVVRALPGARHDEREQFHRHDRSCGDNSETSQSRDAVQ